MFEQNGIFSKHEPFRYINNIDHWLRTDMLGMYWIDKEKLEIKDNTNRLNDYIELFPSSMGTGDDWAAVGWGVGIAMLPMSIRYPEFEWRVILRNPVDTINSLSYYRKVHISQCINKWIQYHVFLLKQIDCMVTRPKVIEFSELCTGALDDKMLAMFGGVRETNVWNIKHNSVGEYIPQNIGMMADVCNAISDVIREACK